MAIRVRREQQEAATHRAHMAATTQRKKKLMCETWSIDDALTAAHEQTQRMVRAKEDEIDLPTKATKRSFWASHDLTATVKLLWPRST